MITRRSFLATTSAAAISAAPRTPPPAPYGAVPTERQLLWHELETTAFLHFTINTFTDKEWGYGDESPNLFHPAEFSPQQIINTLAQGGMRGLILTCKHHDGFCLWPTKTTDHSIRSSSWNGGQGDVVKELASAAATFGLKFGVYLSPWDRNSPHYGTPRYLDIYRAQLTELLTNYGPIFEVWHDGANGGDGFYGGARERRTIDKKTYYDWPNTWDLVRQLQPGAVIFSDAGPDVRWVGNERGIAGDPCWATYDPVAADGGPAAPGDVRAQESPTGQRHASRWLPAECDVSIRPGWFWHENENPRVKTAAQLTDLYYKSVGRGANLLLNVPPNRDGRISPGDAAALGDFGGYCRRTFFFTHDLAVKARFSASNIRGNDHAWAPANLVDGRQETCWAADDDVKNASLLLEFSAPTTFNVVRLKEAIQYGQRVDAIALDGWTGRAWQTLVSANGIGPHRLFRFENPVITTRLRLRITAASASPVLTEFGVYAEPTSIQQSPLRNNAPL